MTMKFLGQMIGFPESSADVRISQYEHDSRTPKPELLNKIAEALDTLPEYLLAPVPSTIDEVMFMEIWQKELGMK